MPHSISTALRALKESAILLFVILGTQSAQGEAMLQYFNTDWTEITRKMPELAEAGYSLASMRANGRSIVVSEIQTKFHASAEELDELTIETEVLEFKRVTTTWRQRILRGDDLICSQDLRAALIDERGRPVRFDDAMLDALSIYAAAPSDPEPT